MSAIVAPRNASSDTNRLGSCDILSGDTHDIHLRENTIVKRLALLIFFFSIPAAALAENGVADPLFAKVHFDTWTGGKAQSPFKWRVQIQPVILSTHQRWLARVDVEIDGAEMESRRGSGALFVLFQFQDSEGHVYQDHGSVDLSKTQAGVKSQIIVYSETAFVMPGNYPLLIGVFDTNSREHWLRSESLHVPAFKKRPIAICMARDLPPVEFHPPEQTPDSWYLPTIEGRLHLPVATRHPLKVDILVNLTPSERSTGSQHIQDRNLSVLLPTMKALAQMELKEGSLNVESLDLFRQKVTFRQEAVRQLDWQKMRDALTSDQVGTIDVKSLGDREHSVQFFEGEVGKRARSADVLIILSSSVRFEQGIDLGPIHAEGSPDCRVYYVRYHPPPVRYVAQQQPMMTRRPALARGPMMQLGPAAVDQLEPTHEAPSPPPLRCPKPWREMRKAVADLLAEISAGRDARRGSG